MSLLNNLQYQHRPTSNINTDQTSLVQFKDEAKAKNVKKTLELNFP